MAAPTNGRAGAAPTLAPRATAPRETPSRLAGKLVGGATLDHGAVEQYRRLAASLHLVQITRDTRVVMITSAVAGEGKTLTAVNLALTLAESYQRRVLLIDLDLRRPSVHRMLGLAASAGLSNLLGASDPALPLIEVSPHLSVLQAGTALDDPMGLLTSQRLAGVLEEAAATFDWVVLDTPPVGLLPDAHLVSSMVDGVVLVIGAGRTPLSAVQHAVAAIGADRIVGTVLNRAREAPVGSAYDYASYARAQGDAA